VASSENTVSKEQAFIHLNMRAIEAKKPADLKFTIINETHQLSPYRQAAFFDLKANQRLYLTAASGLVSIEQNSPYTVWINRLAKHFDLTQTAQTMQFSHAPEGLATEWKEWLPEHLLGLPLKDVHGNLLGLALFAKESEWTEIDINQLTFLHKAYAHALSALKYGKKSLATRVTGLLSLTHWLMAGLILLALMFIPVRLSALAPAEIIALNALSVAAPQDGVIASFLVEPNAPVKKGDALFTLDNTAVNNRYQVAAKALAVAKAEALVAQQRAFDDPQGKAELAGAMGRVREKEAELASVQSLISRVEVNAERNGIAIFTDKNDWIGRPVQTGERVVQIADPQDAGLLIWLPVKDALNIEKGAPMKMFLHTDPLNPVKASLEETSYQASLSPENVASYRLKGAFNDGESLPRIGLQGTARISGEWSFLGYYLFRRPIASVREWTGL